MIRDTIETMIETSEITRSTYYELIEYVCKLCTINGLNYEKDEISTAVVGDMFIQWTDRKITTCDEILRFIRNRGRELKKNYGIDRHIVSVDISDLSESQQAGIMTDITPIGLRPGYKHRTDELIDDMRKFARNHTTAEFAKRYNYTIKTAAAVKSKYGIKTGKLQTKLEIQKDEIFEFCTIPRTYDELVSRFGGTQSGFCLFCKKYKLTVKRKKGANENRI